jgi:hypothetical protein
LYLYVKVTYNMTEFSPSAELRPFLNPAYWDGHMIGDDQPTPHDPDSFTAPWFGATARFAKHTLRERLEVMHTYFPLHTYNTGSTFDPEEWGPGTVTLFDREVLRKTKPNAGFDPDEYSSGEVMARPTDLHPSLDIEASGTEVHKDSNIGITYLRTINWGVVVATKKGRRGLQTTSTSLTFKNPAGRVGIGPMVPQAVPLEMGTTKHIIGERGREERLVRSNILHVCLIGSEQHQKRRSPARIFLGRFATENT